MEITRSKVFSAIRSAIVPPLCVCCREPELSGRPLCGECHRRLRPVGDPRCGRCGAPGVSAESCRECRGRDLGFDRAWSAFRYEGVARDLVHALKTRGALAAAPAMAAAIVDRAPPELIDSTLVPVPAHPSRRRRHGFNHAIELARGVTYANGGGVWDVLKRRDSQRQVGRERSERIANVRDSIEAIPAAAQLNSVALVDDVYTTGATLDACATALRSAGVQRVTALTFARAVKY